MARRYLKINGVWQDHDLFALLQDDARRVGRRGLDADGRQAQGREAARERARAWRALALAVAAARWRRLLAHAPAALALKAIEINNDARPHRDHRARRGLRSARRRPADRDRARRRRRAGGACPCGRQRPAPTPPGSCSRSPTPPTSRSSAGWRPTATARSAPAWCGPISTRGASMPSRPPSATCPSASRTTAPTCSA